MTTTATSARERHSQAVAELSEPRDPDHDAQTPSRPHGRRDSIAEPLATCSVLALCVMARVPHRLLDSVGTEGWALRLVVVIALVTGARMLARAPFTFSRSHSRRTWAAGELKGGAVTILVGAALVIPLYALLRATSYWWLWAGAMFALVTVAGAAAMPLVVRLQSGPLTPAPPELADRVRAVGARAGVDVDPVLVAAPKAGCNAYVVGLGPTRRIVLDGTLATWPGELVDQVVAHEIGHWRLGHLSRRLPLAVATQVATLALAAWVLSFPALLRGAGVTAAGDPRSLPLLLLVTPVLVLPARILLAWHDRRHEGAADRFALHLLHAPEQFAAMLDRAADEGGAPRRLGWRQRATASHPSIDERAQACMRFASTA